MNEQALKTPENGVAQGTCKAQKEAEFKEILKQLDEDGDGVVHMAALQNQWETVVNSLWELLCTCGKANRKKKDPRLACLPRDFGLTETAGDKPPPVLMDYATKLGYSIV